MAPNVASQAREPGEHLFTLSVVPVAWGENSFRVHTRWAEDIGADLVRSAENIVDSARGQGR